MRLNPIAEFVGLDRASWTSTALGVLLSKRRCAIAGRVRCWKNLGCIYALLGTGEEDVVEVLFQNGSSIFTSLAPVPMTAADTVLVEASDTPALSSLTMTPRPENASQSARV